MHVCQRGYPQMPTCRRHLASLQPSVVDLILDFLAIPPHFVCCVGSLFGMPKPLGEASRVSFYREGEGSTELRACICTLFYLPIESGTEAGPSIREWETALFENGGWGECWHRWNSWGHRIYNLEPRALHSEITHECRVHLLGLLLLPL